MSTPPTTTESSTVPSSGGPRLLWLLPLLIIGGVVLYDVYPLLMVNGRIELARDLAAQKRPLSEFRSRLEARGVEIEDISNMPALLIRYLPREPVALKLAQAINTHLHTWGIKIRLPQTTVVVFLDSLDPAIPVSLSRL